MINSESIDRNSGWCIRNKLLMNTFCYIRPTLCQNTLKLIWNKPTNSPLVLHLCILSIKCILFGDENMVTVQF